MKNKFLNVLFAVVLVLSFSLVMATPAGASVGVTVTPAAGGTGISADTTGDTWTTLGAILISEGAAGNVPIGTFVLTIPAGFEFNEDSVPDVTVIEGTPQLAATSPAEITSTTITVVVTANSTTESNNDLLIGNVVPIQVRPTIGTVTSGNITMSSGTIVGVTLDTTNFGTLSIVAGVVDHIDITPDTATIEGGATQAYVAKTYDAWENLLATVTGDTDFSIDEDAGGSWAANVYTSAFEGEWTVTGEYDEMEDTADLDVVPSLIQNENTEQYYQTIQEAIDDASPGDTILVFEGEFEEGDINIEQSITVQGAGGELTYLDAGGDDGFIIDVEGANVTIDGFYIDEADDGIYLEDIYDGSNVTISNNIFEDCDDGIYSESEGTIDGSTVTITGNLIYWASSYGMELYDIYNESTVNITDNQISDSYEGLYIDEVDDDSIVNIEDNIIGGWYDNVEETYWSGNSEEGIYLDDIYTCVINIDGNYINENGADYESSEGIYVYYLENTELNILNNVINQNDGDGIYFDEVEDSSTVTIAGNTIGEWTNPFEDDEIEAGNHDAGIYIDDVDDSTVVIGGETPEEGNVISGNLYGDGITIDYADTSDFTIMYNDIIENGLSSTHRDGIEFSELYQGNSVSIINNDILDNRDVGIQLGCADEADDSNTVLINFNSIAGNQNYGLRVDCEELIVDALYNWWGDAAGPDYETNPYMAHTDGDEISDYDHTTYIPWLIQKELVEGWNTWSFPIIPDTESATQAMADLEEAGVTWAYYFDSDTQAWAIPGVFDDYDTNWIDALYINMDSPVRLRYYFTSELTFPSQKDMKVGWNYVGLAQLYSLDSPDALLDAYWGTGVASDLPGYSKVISPSLNGITWTYLRDTDADGAYMFPVMGYWVFMVNDGTLGGFTNTPITEVDNPI